MLHQVVSREYWQREGALPSFKDNGGQEILNDPYDFHDRTTHSAVINYKAARYIGYDAGGNIVEREPIIKVGGITMVKDVDYTIDAIRGLVVFKEGSVPPRGAMVTVIGIDINTGVYRNPEPAIDPSGDGTKRAFMFATVKGAGNAFAVFTDIQDMNYFDFDRYGNAVRQTIDTWDTADKSDAGFVDHKVVLNEYGCRMARIKGNATKTETTRYASKDNVSIDTEIERTVTETPADLFDVRGYALRQTTATYVVDRVNKIGRAHV